MSKIQQLTLLEIIQTLKKDREETYWWAKGSLDTLQDIEEKICEVARNE